MSAKSKTGLRYIASGLVEVVFTIFQETKQTVRFFINKTLIHNYPIPKGQCKTSNLSTKIDNKDIIRTVNQIYVLTNNLMKLDEPFHSNIIKYNLGQFSLYTKLLLEKPVNVIIQSFKTDNLLLVLGSAKDFKIDKPLVSSLKPETIKKPEFSQIKPNITTKVLKRSESFPTNIPIEKKPIDLLSLSEKELDFFRKQLAKKFNISKFAVKITYIYSKCNVKNLQNIKFDNKTKCLYCNFKPKNKLSNDKEVSFLVFGVKKENNTSISVTVPLRDFDDFKKQL